MKKTYALLAGILVVILSANLVAADVAVGPVDVGANPDDKMPKVCVYKRYVSPDGINNCNYRAGQYAFVGEQIYYELIVRDENGADDIGYVKVRIDNYPELICNQISLERKQCDGLGNMNPLTDKAFECTLTVEPSWGPRDEAENLLDSVLTITVYDSIGRPKDATHSENWYFNPAIALNVYTNDDEPIHFEDGGPGDIVHSENHLKIKNMGEGGVNLWIFLAGTDLYGAEGAAKCPVTNKIDIEQAMKFRGWSGTLGPEWSDFDMWVFMGEYDQNDGCDWACGGSPKKTCYGGKPVPGWSPMDNVLTNNGLMEVEFKLEYPVPCIGTFNNGELLVFGKAI